MRVSDVIAALEKMPPDSEIAVDWVTKKTAETKLKRTISDLDWETAVYDWEVTDYEDELQPVWGQVCLIVDNIAIAQEQNRNYYNDLGV
jgi:S-adenosylmethionine synthetase